MSTTPFRLFVLGDLPRDGGDVALVSLSEYRQARALARTTLRAPELEAIRRAILDLRGFIETGSPVLERRFLEELGGRLFDLVIRSQVRDLFITATAQRRDFVPFELFIESSALASWPWEYLFDTGARMFVCREFHPVSRSIFGQTFSLALGEVRARPRLLVVIGSTDDDEIDVDEEVALLRTVFERLLKQDRFDIVAEPMSARELTTRLQKSRGEFDILHFLGHSGFDLARGEGYLRLKKAGVRETTRLYANDFAQAVADSRIRLAFLNACETARAAVAEDPARSSVAAALLQRGVPAVVAHQFSVPDNGAHFFAGVFYDMLSDGLPLIDAVRAGRAAMGYAEDGRFFDWGIPVLYTRDPQSVVFPPAPADDVRSPRWFQDLDSDEPLEELGGPGPPEFRRYSMPGSPGVAPGLPGVSSGAPGGVIERRTDAFGEAGRHPGHSMARLLFWDSQGREGTIALSPTETVYVGRGLECAIRTDDAMVSRRHSQIRMEGGRYVIEDLGSANGTHLNTTRVQKQALGHTDIIQCGSLMIRFIDEGAVNSVRQQVAPPPGKKGGTIVLDRNEAPPLAGGPQAAPSGFGAMPQPAPRPSGQPTGLPYGGPPSIPGTYGSPPAMPSEAARGGGLDRSVGSQSSGAPYGGPPATPSETPDLPDGGSPPMTSGPAEPFGGPPTMPRAGATPSMFSPGGPMGPVAARGARPDPTENKVLVDLGLEFDPQKADSEIKSLRAQLENHGAEKVPIRSERWEPSRDETESVTLQQAVREFQKRHVREALLKNDWNVTETARELDLSRPQLYQLISEFELRSPLDLAAGGIELPVLESLSAGVATSGPATADLRGRDIQPPAAAPSKPGRGEGAIWGAIRGEVKSGGEGAYYDDGFGGRTKENAERSARAKADQTDDVPPASIAAPQGAQTIQPAADRLGKGTRQPRSATAELTVALVDIDARAGFLAATLEAANRAQRYYEFRLDYLPVPSGAVRRDIAISPAPQLFISALDGFAAETPRQLGADRVCFLTRNLVAGHGQSDLFAAAFDLRHEVFFVSTADIREFAREAGQTFAKAVLRICLSMLVSSDERWNLGYHAATAGCLFDYCDNRHDIVVGLRKLAFDHAPCRSKIKDGNLLAAIDAILALDA